MSALQDEPAVALLDESGAALLDEAGSVTVPGIITTAVLPDGS